MDRQKGLSQRYACEEETLSLVENCIHTGTWFPIPMCMKLPVKLVFDYKQASGVGWFGDGV